MYVRMGVMGGDASALIFDIALILFFPNKFKRILITY